MSEVSLSCQSEIKSHGLRSWTPGPRQLLALPLLEDHGLLFSPAFPRQNLTTNPLLSRCLRSTRGAWWLGQGLAAPCSSQSCFQHVLGQQMDIIKLLLSTQGPRDALRRGQWEVPLCATMVCALYWAS